MIKSKSISNAIFTNCEDGSISEILKNFKMKEYSEMHQTHSDKFLIIKQSGIYKADALITNEKNLPLIVKTADCMPILVSDDINVSAIHAGWRGLQKKILEKTLSSFNKPTLKVFIGPHAQKCCYEVKNDVAFYFKKFIVKREGKIFLNMTGVVQNYLNTFKIKYEISDDCTICNPDYFSYRENKTPNRQFGIIWI